MTACLSDLSASLLPGGAIALFSFALAVLWDVLKSKRDRQQRQRAALQNFYRELASNRKICGSNLMLLKTEQGPLGEGKSKGLVNPLDRLEEGAWPIARLDLPIKLLRDTDLLSRIEVYTGIVHRVNSGLEARERFQIQHLASDVSLLVDGLARYAGIVIYPQEDLITRIAELQRELRRFVSPVDGSEPVSDPVEP